MAMTVLNNTSAMMTLGELNKNINRVGKDLKKVSTGTKITSAQDDASGYAISERMRVQIRGLDQDVQNVQNGRSLLNVAAGGIDNIVEELRSLKELAINAANDTNTDLDRATMQKEFNHRKANINDIATETNYNGMPLLDGRWCRYKAEDDMIVSNSGSGLFANSGLTAVVADPVRGKTCPECAWINGRNVYEGDRNTEYSLDFSSAVNAYGNTPNFPYDMDGEGFFIVCAGNNDGTTASGTNDRYDWHASSHSITFDADMSVGTATAGYLDDYKNFSITVGIAEVRSADDLAAAIYQGVSSLVGVESEFTKLGSTVSIDSKYGDHIHITDNGNGDYSLRRDYGIWLYEGYLDVEEGRDPNMLIIHSGTKANQNVGVNINDMHTLSLKGDVPNAEDISRLERTIPSNYMGNYYEALDNRGAVTPREKYPILSAYVSELASTVPGFKTTDSFKDYAEYRTIVERVRDKSVDDADITNQKNANLAIRIVDGALEYALSESTYIGAYISRLEYTEANITTANENVQKSESTIRDADMAKEMMSYTKNNMLAQASQSMLAQANQNASSVLSLLQ